MRRSTEIISASVSAMSSSAAKAVAICDCGTVVALNSLHRRAVAHELQIHLIVGKVHETEVVEVGLELAGDEGGIPRTRWPMSFCSKPESGRGCAVEQCRLWGTS